MVTGTINLLTDRDTLSFSTSSWISSVTQNQEQPTQLSHSGTLMLARQVIYDLIVDSCVACILLAGSQNPITQQRLPPPPSMSDVEHHFTSISWRDDTSVAVIWMNRVQNLSAVAICPLADNVKYEDITIKYSKIR